MISLKEYLGSASLTDIPVAHVHNMETLLKKMNVLREAWNKPMTVTSGYRTIQEHLRIYSEKKVPQDKIPMSSAHLSGEAIDIYDPGLLITKWLKEDDSSRLQALDLYCEEGNSNWVHLSTRKPKSGKRWFLP